MMKDAHCACPSAVGTAVKLGWIVWMDEEEEERPPNWTWAKIKRLINPPNSIIPIRWRRRREGRTKEQKERKKEVKSEGGEENEEFSPRKMERTQQRIRRWGHPTNYLTTSTHKRHTGNNNRRSLSKRITKNEPVLLSYSSAASASTSTAAAAALWLITLHDVCPDDALHPSDGLVEQHNNGENGNPDKRADSAARYALSKVERDGGKRRRRI